VLQSPKRCVFKYRLKESKESPGHRSPGGRSFHSRGPAAEKLLSPNLCALSVHVHEHSSIAFTGAVFTVELAPACLGVGRCLCVFLCINFLDRVHFLVCEGLLFGAFSIDRCMFGCQYQCNCIKRLTS